MTQDTNETFSLPVCRDYLNKNNCLAAARRILQDGHITGMDELQLAKEIFSHAQAYYLCKKIGMKGFVMRHADPIDLSSGGDKRFMQRLYNICWKMPFLSR